MGNSKHAEAPVTKFLSSLFCFEFCTRKSVHTMIEVGACLLSQHDISPNLDVTYSEFGLQFVVTPKVYEAF